MDKNTAAGVSKIESSKVQGAFDQSLLTASAGLGAQDANTFM